MPLEGPACQVRLVASLLVGEAGLGKGQAG